MKLGKGSITNYFNNWNNAKNEIDPNQFGEHNPHGYEYERVNEDYLTYKLYYGDDHILYKINNYFFRSNKFESINSNSKSFLFSGCSFTYGTGLEDKDIWTNQLLNKTFLDNTQNFNLGVEGGSVFLTIKNIMTFIRKYGKPNYICILMPPVERDLKFDRKSGKFYNVLRGGNYFNGDYPDVYLHYVKNDKQEDDALKVVNYIKLFEDYCNASNILLVWTYWHMYDADLYKEYSFDNIINLSSDFELFPSNWAVAKDILHPGIDFHNFVSDLFYDKIKDTL